jgi:3-dehydroquinate synthase
LSIDDIEIKSKLGDYKVFFPESLIFLKEYQENSAVIYVVDRSVWNQHCNVILEYIDESKLVLLDIHEDMKTLNSVQEIYDQVMKLSPRRNMTLISIGGGITQDVTGFVASSLYRGINWIFVPTTLLAQSDSCIGSKTSLNYKEYKNLIGTFYPPSAVYIYYPLLLSLKEIDYYSGLGEVAKLHILGGEETTLELISSMNMIRDKNQEIIMKAVRTSLLIKQSYIETDEFDKGKRNMLNYGHCFGHAIESATQFAIPHGQAIIIGMIIANKISLSRGLLDAELEEYIAKRILYPLLKVRVQEIVFDTNKIIGAMGQDKKRIGSDLALIMFLNQFEAVKVTDLKEEEARQAIIQFLITHANYQ